MKTGTLLRVAVVGLALTVAVSMASAQLNSGAQTIALNATLTESLTLNLSANAVNFTLAAGSAANAGSTNITATTTWVLKPGRTAVGVYAYFVSSAAALTDGAGNNIPSADFFISDNGGAATALTCGKKDERRRGPYRSLPRGPHARAAARARAGVTCESPALGRSPDSGQRSSA